jgi:hypothetical protein
MTAITLNGVDWTPANFLPQDCIIDFIPRFQNQVEETIPEEANSKSEVTVFVDLLNQIRVWKLKTGFEWKSFSERVNAIVDDKWTATFGGQIWEDDSRTPEKNTTITITWSSREASHRGDYRRHMCKYKSITESHFRWDWSG